MKTPRTTRFFTEEAMKNFAKYPAAKFCAELETELSDITAAFIALRLGGSGMNEQMDALARLLGLDPMTLKPAPQNEKTIPLSLPTLQQNHHQIREDPPRMWLDYIRYVPVM